MTRPSKAWLLTGLLALWTGMLAARILTLEEPHRVPLAHRAGQAMATGGSLHALPKLAGSSDRPARLQQAKNIFAPLSPRSPETETNNVKFREAAGRTRRSGSAGEVRPQGTSMDAAVDLARAEGDQAAQQARQRMAQYRFIGYWTQNGEPRAFLGKGTELYIVRAGETLEGQIRVASIGTTSLRLRDAAHDLESALPLAQGIGSATDPEQP